MCQVAKDKQAEGKNYWFVSWGDKYKYKKWIRKKIKRCHDNAGKKCSEYNLHNSTEVCDQYWVVSGITLEHAIGFLQLCVLVFLFTQCGQLFPSPLQLFLLFQNFSLYINQLKYESKLA